MQNHELCNITNCPCSDNLCDGLHSVEAFSKRMRPTFKLQRLHCTCSLCWRATVPASWSRHSWGEETSSSWLERLERENLQWLVPWSVLCLTIMKRWCSRPHSLLPCHIRVRQRRNVRFCNHATIRFHMGVPLFRPYIISMRIGRFMFIRYDTMRSILHRFDLPQAALLSWMSQAAPDQRNFERAPSHGRLSWVCLLYWMGNGIAPAQWPALHTHRRLCELSPVALQYAKWYLIQEEFSSDPGAEDVWRCWVLLIASHCWSSGTSNFTPRNVRFAKMDSITSWFGTILLDLIRISIFWNVQCLFTTLRNGWVSAGCSGCLCQCRCYVILWHALPCCWNCWLLQRCP